VTVTANVFRIPYNTAALGLFFPSAPVHSKCQPPLAIPLISSVALIIRHTQPSYASEKTTKNRKVQVSPLENFTSAEGSLLSNIYHETKETKLGETESRSRKAINRKDPYGIHSRRGS